MEGTIQDDRFARQITPKLAGENFTLIDIGCAGGIDACWRAFGDHLRAFAFDPNIEECKRLNAAESNRGVQYVPAFVGLDPNHPFARLKAGKPHTGNNPWDRLAVARTVELQREKIATLSLKDKVDVNAWRETSLADANRPVLLPDFFCEKNVTDIDFIKIDVDGPDFEILQSLENTFSDARVLGVGMEVNYAGTPDETDHTFHNTDRFLRRSGFDLFHLTVRRYSNSALPARYLLTIPAQGELGRPLQGDALYVRDVCSPVNRQIAESLSAAKLLKTAAIFWTFDLPDCAAEILVKFRARLEPVCDVQSLLDLLAAYVQKDEKSRSNYRDYVAAFERNDERFYLPGQRPVLGRR